MARLNKNSKLGWEMIKILKGKNLNLFSSFFPNVLVHLHFSISHPEETAVSSPTRTLRCFEHLLWEHNVAKLYSGEESSGFKL